MNIRKITLITLVDGKEVELVKYINLDTNTFIEQSPDGCNFSPDVTETLDVNCMKFCEDLPNREIFCETIDLGILFTNEYHIIPINLSGNSDCGEITYNVVDSVGVTDLIEYEDRIEFLSDSELNVFINVEQCCSNGFTCCNSIYTAIIENQPSIDAIDDDLGVRDNLDSFTYDISTNDFIINCEPITYSIITSSNVDITLNETGVFTFNPLIEGNYFAIIQACCEDGVTCDTFNITGSVQIPCEINNIQVTQNCNGTVNELIFAFDTVNTSGAYEISFNGAFFVPYNQGDIYPIDSPAISNVSLIVRDVNDTSCSGSTTFDLIDCVDCSITNIQVTQNCNDTTNELVVSFTEMDTSGSFELNVNGAGFVPYNQGDIYSIPNATIANGALIEVRDANNISCIGSTTVDLIECVLSCSISDIIVSQQCIGEDNELSIIFDTINTSGNFEINVNGNGFEPYISGSTYIITNSTDIVDAVIEVRDANDINCIGSTTLNLSGCTPDMITCPELDININGQDGAIQLEILTETATGNEVGGYIIEWRDENNNLLYTSAGGTLFDAALHIPHPSGDLLVPSGQITGTIIQSTNNDYVGCQIFIDVPLPYCTLSPISYRGATGAAASFTGTFGIDSTTENIAIQFLTYNVADRIIVTYENSGGIVTLYDTGDISTGGSLYKLVTDSLTTYYETGFDVVTVNITSNAPDPETRWEIRSVECCTEDSCPIVDIQFISCAIEEDRCRTRFNFSTTDFSFDKCIDYGFTNALAGIIFYIPLYTATLVDQYLIDPTDVVVTTSSSTNVVMDFNNDSTTYNAVKTTIQNRLINDIIDIDFRTGDGIGSDIQIRPDAIVVFDDVNEIITIDQPISPANDCTSPETYVATNFDLTPIANTYDIINVAHNRYIVNTNTASATDITLESNRCDNILIPVRFEITDTNDPYNNWTLTNISTGDIILQS